MLLDFPLVDELVKKPDPSYADILFIGSGL